MGMAGADLLSMPGLLMPQAPRIETLGLEMAQLSSEAVQRELILNSES